MQQQPPFPFGFRARCRVSSPNRCLRYGPAAAAWRGAVWRAATPERREDPAAAPVGSRRRRSRRDRRLASRRRDSCPDQGPGSAAPTLTVRSSKAVSTSRRDRRRRRGSAAPRPSPLLPSGRGIEAHGAIANWCLDVETRPEVPIGLGRSEALPAAWVGLRRRDDPLGCRIAVSTSRHARGRRRGSAAPRLSPLLPSGPGIEAHGAIADWCLDVETRPQTPTGLSRLEGTA